MFRGVSISDIRRVTAKNEKQRFQINEGRIRANQGHSLKTVTKAVETPYNVDVDGSVAIHGTYQSLLPKIKASGGLSKMKRNHVPMALPKDVNTMTRKTCDLFIKVDVRALIKAGFSVLKSTNGVILCEGDRNGFIPNEYLKFY